MYLVYSVQSYRGVVAPMPKLRLHTLPSPNLLNGFRAFLPNESASEFPAVVVHVAMSMTKEDR